PLAGTSRATRCRGRSLCEKRPGGRSVPVPVLVATIGDSVQGNVDARARPGHGAVVAKLGLRIDSTAEFSSWRPTIHNRTPPRGSRRACARVGERPPPAQERSCAGRAQRHSLILLKPPPAMLFVHCPGRYWMVPGQ